MSLDIDAAVGLVREQTGHSVSALRPMTSLSNSAWLVRVGEELAVLRIHTLSFGDPVTNHVRELRIHALAEDHGLSPAVLFADTDNGILLTRYEPAGAIPEHSITPAMLTRIAKSLAALHSISVPSDLDGYSLTEAANCYWHRAGRPQDEQSLAWRDTVLRHEREYPVPERVLCHRDVLHSNLLDTDPVQFIDWEFASPGDRWFDLAALCRWHKLDNGTSRRVIEDYLGRSPVQDEIAAHHRACTAFDALCGLWSLPAVA